MTDTRRLIAPMIDADSEMWWMGLTRGVLLLQLCMDCRQHRCPPLPACAYCGSADSRTIAATGLGSIYTWTTVHRSLAPEYVGEEPYTVLAVDLDEGPRIFGRLLVGSPAAGVRVSLQTYSVDGQALPGFAEILTEPSDASNRANDF